MKTKSTRRLLDLKAFVTILILSSLPLTAAEVTNQVSVITVKRMCDSPGCNGEMKPTDQMLTSLPSQYPHKCTVCGTNQTFLVCYPEVRLVQ